MELPGGPTLNEPDGDAIQPPGSSQQRHSVSIPPSSYDANLPWHSYTVVDVVRLITLKNPSASGLIVGDETTQALHRRQNGIAEDDVAQYRSDFGDNKIPVKDGPHVLYVLLMQFLTSINFILGAVAVVAGIFKDWPELVVVVFVILFNSLLGFYQEWSAAKSIEGLKRMTAGSAKVVRDGVVDIVDIDEVVVGDTVVLEQGCLVPADIRITEASNLDIDEALLTGEALPVNKDVDPIPMPTASDIEIALGDRKNMAFRNTLVTQGSGQGIVVAGGLNTQIGRLAERLSEDDGSSKTPLMKKMDIMMYVLFGICLILALLVFAANKMRFSHSTLIYACSVAIAIVPESLGAVVTVAMTISIRRMAQEGCIVRRLGSLEVLGGVTDICSDKTGTLTENKMVVKTAVVGIYNSYTVKGAPRGAEGAFLDNRVPVGESPKRLDTNPAALDTPHLAFFRCAAMCCAASLAPDEEEPGMLASVGNPTEVALQVMAWKAGLNPAHFEDNERLEEVGEYAFDSVVKCMSVVIRDPTGALVSFTKGAAEVILPHCRWMLSPEGELVPFTDIEAEVVNSHVEHLAAKGLRTLCLARRNTDAAPLPTMPEGWCPTDRRYDSVHPRTAVEGEFIYVGLVGIYDPPRPESGPSVEQCQRAGIKVRMLTGDHASTAVAIAKSLGIVPEKKEDEEGFEGGCVVINGPTFDAMTDEEIDEMPFLPSVVSRCSPQSKVRMIEALHRRGRVAAMTGDGFNDSPSIKQSDIGCAMGSGTDVTKGVADMVITDDDFTTIVKAVAEGRRVADVIKKFVVSLLSSNVAQVIVLVIGLAIRHEDESVFILSPIEILWANMLTGSAPAIGLSLDDPEDNILEVPPNRKGFFTLELILDTLVYGCILGVSSLCAFIFVMYGPFNDDYSMGHDCNVSSGVGCDTIWRARSTAFVVINVGLMLQGFNVRSTRKSIVHIGWFDNPWIWGSAAVGIAAIAIVLYVEVIARDVFIHAALTWEWVVVFIGLLIFESTVELYKLAKNYIDPLQISTLPRKRELAVNGKSSSSSSSSNSSATTSDMDEKEKKFTIKNNNANDKEMTERGVDAMAIPVSTAVTHDTPWCPEGYKMRLPKVPQPTGGVALTPNVTRARSSSLLRSDTDPRTTVEIAAEGVRIGRQRAASQAYRPPIATVLLRQEADKQ